jgi:uncharacterized membrane protein YkvI
MAKLISGFILLIIGIVIMAIAVKFNARDAGRIK